MSLHDFDAVARTSLLTTALRTKETARPDRLYGDPYAELLTGDVGMALLDEVAGITDPNHATVSADGHKLPNTYDFNAIRTRFLDEWLIDGLAGGRFDQVVIAAAGMDTRAYRLAWPVDVHVFELDRAAVLDFKDDRLAGHDLAAGVKRHPVRADLVRDDWWGALTEAGFDAVRPAMWLFEGLFYYIAESDTRKVLARLGDLCPPGSLIACDLVNEVTLQAPSTELLRDVFVRWGSPWVFGRDEPETFFAAYGFEVVALQPGEPGAHFGRWQDEVVPRVVPDVPRAFYVHGRRV
ncbi:SAM-dependent methyltransferase [Kibdelosporangium aridum]|uniref:SAM-dependent methyltransferase n=1 Tax=Kibdelosporangium aridum TaxID=2030 RepID=UPI000527E036